MSYPPYSNFTSPDLVPENQVPNNQRKRKVTIGIIVAVVVLLLCCCALIAALLILDPFGWGLLNRLTGRFDPVAKASPPDTTMFVGINLLNATPAKIDPIISAFNEAFKDYLGEDIEGASDVMDQIDDSLSEFDMTVEEDIMPWVGQYAGMGLLNVDVGEYGYPENADYYFAVEARDRGNADNFLVKLADELSQSWDVNVDTSEYQGATIYSVDEDYQALVFTRSGNLVIVANSENTIKEVIDAQSGASLAEDAVYSQLMHQLPSERMVTFYIPASALTDLSGFYTDFTQMAGADIDDLYASTTGMAASLSVIDAGIRMDSVVAYDTAELSELQRQMLDITGRSTNAANILPAETYAYVTGQHLDQVWEYYYEALSATTAGDFDEALQELEDEIGLNPNTDLFPYLTDTWMIGVFPSSDGLFAEQLEFEIGFLIASQANDEGALINTLDNFNYVLEDTGGAEINESSSGNMTIYEAIDTYSGSPMIAYGVGGGWFGLANSVDILAGMPEQSDPLSGDPTYRAAQALLPGDMGTVIYVNLAGALDSIYDGMDSSDRDYFDESTFFLRPIEYLIAGSSPLSGDVVHSTLILSIPTP